MKPLVFFAALLMGSVAVSRAAEPEFVFENRPSSGLPAEAARQDRDSTVEYQQVALSGLLTSLSWVRVRYVGHAWKDQVDFQKYLSGLLADASIRAQSHTQWSESLGEPDAECQLRFDGLGTGLLSLWGPIGCLRDASGRWWFFRCDDYYKSHYPKTPGNA